MDPHATYEALNRAFAEGDRVGALEALEALTGWIRSGGYFPEPFLERWTVCAICSTPYTTGEIANHVALAHHVESTHPYAIHLARGTED